MISITAFGRVPAGKMVHRSGAKPGDRIVVTGTIGDAALGLDVLKGGAVASGARERCRGARDADRRATACRSRAMRSRRPCAIMPARRWTSPTALPAISQSSARPPACRPRSMLPQHSAIGGGARAGGARRSRHRDAGLRRRRLRDPVHDSGDRLRRFAAGGAAGRASPSPRSGPSSPGPGCPVFLDAQGRELALARLSYSHF